ncbi:hypothetical protein ACFSDD_10925 [Salipiger marinus]|uniref:hypothetical protein n=1 Tax=Salipiger marinus TaxID=555512 RepID=UPI002C4CB227|nr:hypothetical protein [Salipiger manganoxidans]MEB3419883.1 hypothetical protein [Salipiger manganoxidans]
MALSKTPQEVIQGSPIDPNKQPSPAEMTTLLTEMREEYIGLEDAVAYASLLRQSWVGLTSLAPSGIGQRAEVSDNDTGSHTDPQTGLTVPNAGQYTAFGTGAGDWTWVQATGLGGKLSASANLSDVPAPGTARTNIGAASQADMSTALAAIALRAPLDSPALAGTPTAPTPAAGNNTARIATTEYVVTAITPKANADAVVALTGAQTVAGVKTFSSAPVVPDGAFSVAKTTGLQAALDGKAALSHAHAISGVTGLEAALEGKAEADDLAATDARTIHAPDRPGDNPEAFSTTLTGAGADKAALSGTGVASVSGSGLCYALTGAGAIAVRNPIALGRDVWEITARFRRTLNPADPNNHAVGLRVAWLDAGKAQISLQTLETRSDALTSSGLIQLSARLSALDVEGVIAPPPGAVYACPYIQTYGEDGATAVETLRVAEITDLALADIGDLSGMVAEAQAAIDAANAASLVATETLDTMADVATYSRPSDVTVITLKGGYAAHDGLGGQWAYDPTDTMSASAPPDVLVGADGARYKRVQGVPVKAPSVAALRATGPLWSPVYLQEFGRQGLYEWSALIQPEEHQVDTERFVAPVDDQAGAWVRTTGGNPLAVQTADVIDLRPRVAGRGRRLERVWQLPDPTEAGQYDREVLLVGQPPIRAWCDGAQWWDLGAGTVIDPWWLPRNAQVHVDFDNARFYWDGAVKSLSDLTDNGDGSYLLTPATPIDSADGYQVIVFDTTMDMTDEGKSGSFWQVRESTGNTGNLRAQPPVGTNTPIRIIGNYYDTSGQTINLSLVSIDGETATYPATGRHRQMLWLHNGEQVKYQPDNGDFRDAGPAGARVVTTIPDIAVICLGCSYTAAVGPAGPLSGGTLHTLTIYNRDVSAAEIEAIGRDGIGPPVHILGDSFMTLYRPQHNINKLLADEDISGYLALSSDAVGGTTLEEQAIRYAAANRKWRNSTLIIGEMGASFLMPAALKRILGTIQTDRWLVLESAPAKNQIYGSAARAEWDRRRDELREVCGPNWVPTLELAFALSDGSPEDEADVANGIWPRSLTKSEEDFHPSALGDDFLAAVIVDALQARGWLLWGAALLEG